jgi:hypothetical protein
LVGVYAKKEIVLGMRKKRSPLWEVGRGRRAGRS